MDSIMPLLLAIGKASLIGLALSLFIFLFFAIRDRKINSSLVAMIIVVFLGVIMRLYVPHLLALKKSLGSEYLGHILFAWYMGFFLLDALAIFVLYKVHVAFTIRYSMIAKMVLVGYSAQGQIHLIRYSERLLMGFDSQYLKPIYQAGIPAVNIGMASISLCFAMAMIISRYRSSKGKEGLKWVL